MTKVFFICLTAWFALAVPIALYIGRALRNAQRPAQCGDRGPFGGICPQAPGHDGDHGTDAMQWGTLGGAECQGADFSRVAAVLADGIEEHIRRDRLSPVAAAVFRDRGGHAPGERCPSEPDPEPIHDQSCDLLYDGEWCTCGAAR